MHVCTTDSCIFLNLPSASSVSSARDNLLYQSELTGYGIRSHVVRSGVMTNTKQQALYAVRIDSTESEAAAIEARLEEQSINMTVWQDKDTGSVIFREYFDSADKATARLAELEQGIPGREPRIETVEAKDWAEAWKEHFTTSQISDRIVIKPSWETYTDNNRCVIELDPGMSFGTGLHFTTRSCLQLIDKSTLPNPAARFCDLGCGSGILSIAALLLGCEHAVAFDNDPLAVAATIKNAAHNGVGGRVACRQADLATLELDEPAQLVAANVLANPLKDYAETIAQCVAKEGHLILAGITPEQYPEVKGIYSTLGLKEVATLCDASWQTGLFEGEGNV